MNSPIIDIINFKVHKNFKSHISCSLSQEVKLIDHLLHSKIPYSVPASLEFRRLSAMCFNFNILYVHYLNVDDYDPLHPFITKIAYRLLNTEEVISKHSKLYQELHKAHQS